ncbi:hypothetical protein LTR86_006097 [Recurvomyces mirabilis]|nr:hypothetical protein LTR86_006097 [Recurvomyces mirabilis]
MFFLETAAVSARSYPLRHRHYQSLNDVAAAKLTYGILSHTWGKDEVTYADVVAQRGTDKAGYAKVRNAIQCAREDGFKLIWIDNCCINKDSSAELSEAINSIAAGKCYAYLEDVAYPEKVDVTEIELEFHTSRWFGRGWTLQELLAPRDLVFYDQEWRRIEDKVRMQTIVAKAARIRTDILTGQRLLSSASIAERMSWAAGRETTREEDKAYCLMGLFAVNMPMLYGEGDRAFQRLQEEIMKVSDDHSLFAWMSKTLKPGELHGLLADSPDDFAFPEAPDIRAYSSWEKESPYAMTNRGLDIELHLSPRHDTDRHFTAALHCPSPTGQGTFLAVVLQKLGSARDDDRYARVQCHRLQAIGERGVRVAMYIPQGIAFDDQEGEYPLHVLKLEDLPAPYVYLKIERVDPFNNDDKRMLPEVASNRYAKILKMEGRVAVMCTIKDIATDTTFLVRLGSAKRLTVGFDVVGAILLDYKPLDSGCTADLPLHQLRVDMPERVFPGTKIYIVQFTIQRKQTALATQIYEDVTDRLVGMMPAPPATARPPQLEPKPRTSSNRQGFLRNVGLRR